MILLDGEIHVPRYQEIYKTYFFWLANELGHTWPHFSLWAYHHILGNAWQACLSSMIHNLFVCADPKTYNLLEESS